jgi:hypothetical protein
MVNIAHWLICLQACVIDDVILASWSWKVRTRNAGAVPKGTAVVSCG